ncbi:hypothetical protein VRRI112168_00125 [Vreelandella rituensis]|uniref:Uncharacterized protein n=1 Tax=Vreelandella rituensis TaxID=2282306 RepID=A0A368UA46_9GAMM|nr:hypothetical protein [Halomonas rituensis]RCV93895.1 hypothetical protein DU506_01680 [Halomonas rituensis]
MTPITINYYISARSAPLVYRHMLAQQPHHRKRHIGSILPMGCEVVLRTLRLGGSLYSGGKLNPAEFAVPGRDDSDWSSTMVSITIYPYVTPLLYEAIDGRSEGEVRTIVTTLLESYLLTLGATTAPLDSVTARAPGPVKISMEISESSPAEQAVPAETQETEAATPAPQTAKPDSPEAKQVNEKASPTPSDTRPSEPESQKRKAVDEHEDEGMESVLDMIAKKGKAT